jgi:hypothetical protein
MRVGYHEPSRAADDVCHCPPVEALVEALKVSP